MNSKINLYNLTYPYHFIPVAISIMENFDSFNDSIRIEENYSSPNALISPEITGSSYSINYSLNFLKNCLYNIDDIDRFIELYNSQWTAGGHDNKVVVTKMEGMKYAEVFKEKIKTWPINLESPKPFIVDSIHADGREKVC